MNEKEYYEEKLNSNINIDDLQNIITNINNTSKLFFKLNPEQKFIRSEMINWMNIICKEMRFSVNTYNTSIDIYDVILTKFNSNLSYDDFCLIAITCIFISCKIHEGKAIQINFLVQKIGQCKFEKDDYLMTEVLILKTLNFRIPQNYFIDFVNCVLKIILPTLECIISEDIYKNINTNYKLTLVNLDLLRKFDLLTIYISIIYYTIAQGIYKNKRIFDNSIIVKFNELLNYLNISNDELIYIVSILSNYDYIINDNKNNFSEECHGIFL